MQDFYFPESSILSFETPSLTFGPWPDELLRKNIEELLLTSIQLTLLLWRLILQHLALSDMDPGGEPPPHPLRKHGQTPRRH